MKKVLLGLGVLALSIVAVYRHYSTVSPTGRCSVIARWGQSGTNSAGLYHPMGLAWGGDLLYVVEPEKGLVKRFREDGSLVSVWSGFGRPVAVAPTDSLIYVADFLNDHILVLTTSGTLAASWGKAGTGAGEFDAPSGVAVDSQGNVYVTDFYNHRVQKFTSDGQFRTQWGSRGRRNGRFRYPTGIAVTRKGEILVADGFNNRVQRFTANGWYLDKWGGTGYGFGGSWPGWFALAKDVATGPRGAIYVGDAFNGRIQAFTAEGRLEAIWGDDRNGNDVLEYASGVAVDRFGQVYVTDFFANELWKLECRTTGIKRMAAGGRSHAGSP